MRKALVNLQQTHIPNVMAWPLSDGSGLPPHHRTGLLRNTAKHFEGFKPKAQGSEAPEAFRDPRSCPKAAMVSGARDGIEAGAGLFNFSAQVSRFRGVDKREFPKIRGTFIKIGSCY